MTVRFLFPEGFIWFLLTIVVILSIISFWKISSDALKGFLVKQWRGLPLLEALVGIGALAFLAFTLARPVMVATGEGRYSFPSGASMIFTFDVTKSMKAAAAPYEKNRLDRARDIALQISKSIQGKTGVAGFTDLLALHLFPTEDRVSLETVLNDTLRVSSVPFGFSDTTRITAIADAAYGFFPADDEQKILVVFTDGDSPYSFCFKVGNHCSPIGEVTLLKTEGITVIFVGMGKAGEHVPIYDETGKFVQWEPRATNTNDKMLRESAEVLEGKYFSENETEKLIDYIQRL